MPDDFRSSVVSAHRTECGCQHPDCTHTRFVDGHPVRHSADGGETKLSNLVSLCRLHHRQVHEGRVRVERLDDGAWRFLKPSGEEFMSAAPQRAERGNVSAATPG